MGAERSVAFAMNYPADEAHRLWTEGKYPAFHLMGCPTLEAAGYSVSYLPLGREHARTRTGRRLRFVLGARLPQLRAAMSGASVAYAGDPTTFATLAHLRAVGAWSRPVVAFVHPNVVGHKVFVRALRGYDVVITPSRLIYGQLIDEVGLSPHRTLLAPCGPDLTWRGYTPESGSLVVSSGKTHRDERTLVAALSDVGLPARVHTRDFVGSRRTGSVELVGGAAYPDVLRDLCSAGIVAIPLARVDGTYGLSELNDALALAKPMVMTRNPYNDADPEAIGCGYVVDRGDRQGWVAALGRLRDPALRREMGLRGRAFAEDSWNAALFGEAVLGAINLAAGW